MWLPQIIVLWFIKRFGRFGCRRNLPLLTAFVRSFYATKPQIHAYIPVLRCFLLSTINHVFFVAARDQKVVGLSHNVCSARPQFRGRSENDCVFRVILDIVINHVRHLRFGVGFSSGPFEFNPIEPQRCKTWSATEWQISRDLFGPVFDTWDDNRHNRSTIKRLNDFLYIFFWGGGFLFLFKAFFNCK